MGIDELIEKWSRKKWHCVETGGKQKERKITELVNEQSARRSVSWVYETLTGGWSVPGCCCFIRKLGVVGKTRAATNWPIVSNVYSASLQSPWRSRRSESRWEVGARTMITYYELNAPIATATRTLLFLPCDNNIDRVRNSWEKHCFAGHRSRILPFFFLIATQHGLIPLPPPPLRAPCSIDLLCANDLDDRSKYKTRRCPDLVSRHAVPVTSRNYLVRLTSGKFS